MSGSDTESDGELTPIMTQYQNSQDIDGFESSNNYLENLSQLDSMLAPKSSKITSSQAVIKATGNSSMANKRSSLLVPALKTKFFPRPEPSMSDLRNEAIRIIKKLPRGDVTLWRIMQYLEMSDIRLLSKYKRIKLTGNKKQDIGQCLLSSFQSGEFKSIIQSIEDEVNTNRSGKKTSMIQKPKENISNSQVKNNTKDMQISKVDSIITSSSSANLIKAAPIPVVAVGESNQWKLVDNRKLLICCHP